MSASTTSAEQGTNMSGGNDTSTLSMLPPGILQNNTSNDRLRGRNNGRRSNGTTSTRNNSGDTSKMKDFEGETSEIGAVLCMSNEEVEKGKDSFPSFHSKLEEYVLQEYDNTKDITYHRINPTGDP